MTSDTRPDEQTEPTLFELMMGVTPEEWEALGEPGTVDGRQAE